MALTNDTTFTVDKWAATKEAEKAASVAGSGTNPNSQLDKDAFLQLLLVELQYQDPTDPMDTAKMLEQTSQLASLEMQENTNQIMQKLATQMQSSFSMTAMSALGKIANLSNAVSKDENTSSVSFSLNFEEAAVSGTVEIYNSTGNQIKTMSFSDLSAGLNSFIWDGTNDSGEQVSTGEYLIKATYYNANGDKLQSVLGQYPVEGIKFADGTAQVKIAGQYVDIDQISEFTEPTNKS